MVEHTTKTFGKLRYGTIDNGAAAWGLDVVPHVAIRVKRLFPRAYQPATGTIILTDTPEVARDLEWFLERHPLEVTDETRARLTKRADEHRATEQAITDILVHGTRLTGWQEPTRPGRDYQVQGADLAWTVKGMILGDDLGLGKTQTGLMLLRDPDTLPALVVCPTHLTKQWQRELAAVFPMMKAHIGKKTIPPDQPIDADVIILTYSKLHGWRDKLAGQVKTVIFDEVQDLRHQGTNKYEAAEHVAGDAQWRLGMSATPVYNYGGEIWNIYNILAPGVLGSHTEFSREWGGRMIGANLTVGDPGALGEYLRDQGLMLRRTRKQVHREVPEPQKVLQEIPSNTDLIDDVAADLGDYARMLLDGDTDSKERMRMGGEISWRLRHATGVGKAPFVADFVKLLLESEEKVLLFGWHHEVYDIWNRALAEYRPVMFTGQETPTQKEAARVRFMEDPACRVLMMSLRSGSGLDGLQEVSSVAVFGELDWSPAQHDQAIGRLARDGQESTVVAYFLVTGAGADPVIADALELKRQQQEPIRNPDEVMVGKAVSTVNDEGRARILAKALLGRTT